MCAIPVADCALNAAVTLPAQTTAVDNTIITVISINSGGSSSGAYFKGLPQTTTRCHRPPLTCLGGGRWTTRCWHPFRIAPPPPRHGWRRLRGALTVRRALCSAVAPSSPLATHRSDLLFSDKSAVNFCSLLETIVCVRGCYSSMTHFKVTCFKVVPEYYLELFARKKTIIEQQ